jgi:hypothetical protein
MFTSIPSPRSIRRASALIVSVLLGACTAQSDRSSSENVAEAKSKLLATLQLSDTHTIEFREVRPGLVSLIETRSLDADRDEPTYALYDDGDLKLAEAYSLMAGDRAKDSDLVILEQADARKEAQQAEGHARSVRFGSSQAASFAPPTAAQGAQTPEVHATPAADGLVEKANCPTNLDWTADANFWKGNLCDSQSLDCVTGKSWASYEWWTTTNFSAAGIAQDTCNTARLYVRYQGTQPPFIPCFGNGGIWIDDLFDVTIQPRTAVTVYASGGGTGICDYHYAYSTKVEKRDGPNGSRVGLVINPKSFGPCQRGCNWNGTDACNCGI